MNIAFHIGFRRLNGVEGGYCAFFPGGVFGADLEKFAMVFANQVNGLMVDQHFIDAWILHFCRFFQHSD